MYSVQWWRYDNNSGNRRLIPGATSFQVPPAQGYLQADVSDGTYLLKVYLLGSRVVGLDR